MKIGTKRAVNGQLRKLVREIDRRIQHWAAFTETGGVACAKERLLEGQAIRDLVEASILPLSDKPKPEKDDEE